MSLSLPYPNSPTNGDALNADPVRANIQAIEQAIQSFDGAQIQPKSVAEGALADAINPRLRASETSSSFVQSGCVWSSVSGLNGTMTGGTVYVNGYRTVVASIASHTFTASNDTYIDIDYLGNVTYQGVANSAASPAITANSIRVAKVVTNGSAITSVVKTGSDSLSNLIYPTLANQKVSVLRQDDTTSTQKTSSVMLTGWGVITPGVTNSASETVTFGVTFTALPIVIITCGGDAASATTYGSGANTIQGSIASKAHTITTTSFIAHMFATGNWGAGNTVFYQWMAIGEVA